MEGTNKASTSVCSILCKSRPWKRTAHGLSVGSTACAPTTGKASHGRVWGTRRFCQRPTTGSLKGAKRGGCLEQNLLHRVNYPAFLLDLCLISSQPHHQLQRQHLFTPLHGLHKQMQSSCQRQGRPLQAKPLGVFGAWPKKGQLN